MPAGAKGLEPAASYVTGQRRAGRFHLAVKPATGHLGEANVNSRHNSDLWIATIAMGVQINELADVPNVVCARMILTSCCAC
jgi:hypothetical protein